MSGWHSVQRVCSEANISEPSKITATAMRHRASTIYAAMEVPEHERQLFYKHLGHSALVNANVYQAPLAVEEVRTVGKRLQQMDNGISKYFFSLWFSSPLCSPFWLFTPSLYLSLFPLVHPPPFLASLPLPNQPLFLNPLSNLISLNSHPVVSLISLFSHHVISVSSLLSFTPPRLSLCI